MAQSIPAKPVILAIRPPSNSAVEFQPPMPIFNHIPTTLHTGVEDKESVRAERNREHQRRHVAKVKPYQQLANIYNPEERLVALIMLSYPELSALPKYVLHQDVDLFMRALKSRYANPTAMPNHNLASPGLIT